MTCVATANVCIDVACIDKVGGHGGCVKVIRDECRLRNVWVKSFFFLVASIVLEGQECFTLVDFVRVGCGGFILMDIGVGVGCLWSKSKDDIRRHGYGELWVSIIRMHALDALGLLR